VFVGGVIVDASGVNAIDCTIRDINVHGAQVESQAKFEIGDQVYLLNTRNENAHDATITWTKDERTGLSFVRTYSLEVAVPPQLGFLGRLLVEAKFRQLTTLIERGVHVSEAASVVGLTEEYLERFAGGGDVDEKFELLLHLAKRLLFKG